MPRAAEHAARRAQIRAGTRQVALEQGLGRVTFAGAARASGVSVGLIQHYYASKERLLADTLEGMLDSLVARVDRAIERAERRHTRIEHMMLAGVEQLLPLDRRRREDTYLRHAFTGLALDDLELRGRQQQFDDRVLARIATGIRNATECGEVPGPVDVEAEAYAVLALVEGLAGRLLVHADAGRRARARSAVAAHLTVLFPGPCVRDLG